MKEGAAGYIRPSRPCTASSGNPKSQENSRAAILGTGPVKVRASKM
jgi:hypothetical protein